MKNKNLYYVIGVILLLAQVGFMVTQCESDTECTQTAFKERVRAGMVLKSSSSKSAVAANFTPSTKENPLWMDWESRNIDLDNLSGGYYAGISVDELDQTYYVGPWIGFKNSITIPLGEELRMRSVNCIIKGDINGSGTLIFESYQADKNYDLAVGAKLVVEGSVGGGVNIVLNDNATLETGIALSDNDGGLGDKVRVEVPCDWTLPKTVSDENGVKWYYTDYN